MAWDHLDINKPHLVYIVLGGFTSLFMLCSSIIKERFYIGEATVATLVGIIFGPHAANLINPFTWGNTDQITLEFARIVLVVQCFAVGVELPKAYMERHWRSVVFLLVPVMTFGWLMTSLFIWGLMFHVLSWLDSLVIAACVTATDPVLASSVVGKGKFAKRVPKHLRDLLSAESGCNDGMAFPFIYLALYITRYRPNVGDTIYHWICITILYECIFGAVYGVAVGYIARRAIRYAHEKDIIDRESFLVFYFVLALFCAGSGSILGIDDLLVGFACGVGFSNDGWFTEKTEETHVSNVIDLLINLAFFVYFGTIIPWPLYNSALIGTSPWRLVVIAILVLLFRRIPIMMALKPLIPDVKTWREALFAGHFGPIGVGAIFVAILARAELETDSTTPLAELPDPGTEWWNIIELIWPITTFLVLTSIIVHGSSIAVFTLGKHINTLTITMSYTQANENANWMDRLPRIQSRSKSSMSKGKGEDESDESLEEKMLESPSGAYSLPRNFLRRQKEEDTPGMRHRKSRDIKFGAGGPISRSAIAPVSSREGSIASAELEQSESDTLAATSNKASPNADDDKAIDSSREHSRGRKSDEPEEECYQEGDDTIIEDEQGNVLEVMHSKRSDSQAQRDADAEHEARRLMSKDHVKHGVAQDMDKNPMESMEQDAQEVAQAAAKGHGWQTLRSRLGKYGHHKDGIVEKPRPESERKHGPARAFRFGRTIIVEDEDGEVIKKYDIPASERPQNESKQSWVDYDKSKQRIQKMGRFMGLGGGATATDQEGGAGPARPQAQRSQSSKAIMAAGDDDDRIRFTVDGNTRRMSKAEFIAQIQSLDPRSRAEVVQESNAPTEVKKEAKLDLKERQAAGTAEAKFANEGYFRRNPGDDGHITDVKSPNSGTEAAVHKVETHEDRPQGSEGLTLNDPHYGDIPVHSVSADLRQYADEKGETAAARRRRLAYGKQSSKRSPSPPAPVTEEDEESDSEDDGTARVPPSERKKTQQQGSSNQPARVAALDDEEEETPAEKRRRQQALRLGRRESRVADSGDEERETPAERRRRKAALGHSKDDSPDNRDRSPESGEASPKPRGIRFADQIRKP